MLSPEGVDVRIGGGREAPGVEVADVELGAVDGGDEEEEEEGREWQVTKLSGEHCYCLSFSVFSAYC